MNRGGEDQQTKGRKNEREGMERKRKDKDQLDSEVEKKTRDAIVYERETCARLRFSHRPRDIQN